MLGSSRGVSTENGLPLSPLGEGNGASRSGAEKNRRGTRYEVQERLGEGALWIAYRVRPAQTGGKNSAPKAASIALKALRGAANGHPRLPDALNEEAARWSGLSHPHLAVPHEWGTESGTLYFTTTLLTGGSLSNRLARGPLAPEEAMQLLRALSATLGFLHARDLIHGDVRPRQVLFDASGFPVLTDGGHALALSLAGLALADLQPDAALFLAPERTGGQPLSPASDIYSLGATFYAALTGRAPFEGGSPLAIAARHRHEAPVPPSSLRAPVPREWDALALRLLAKNPDERPTAADLERLLAPKTKNAAPVAAPSPTNEQNGAPAVVPLAAAPVIAPPTPSVPDIAPVQANAPQSQPLDLDVPLAPDPHDEKAQKGARKKAHRRHKWREFGGMIGAILCLALLIGGGVEGALYAYDAVLKQIPKQVEVPKYLGLSQEKAKVALSKAGLGMKVVRESYDPKVPAGTVMDGDPGEGREVRSKRDVLVTVSAGEAPIKMVDFSQLSLDQARTIILQHGMKLGSIAEQYDDKTPRGSVLGQYPQAGDAFSRSQPITLIVSRGTQPKEIDAQNNEFAPPDPIGNAPAPPTSALDANNNSFAPLEPATSNPKPEQTAPKSGLETRSALVRVSIPKGGRAQLVRIIVSDAKGERTVYQRARRAGVQFEQKVSVTRDPNQQAQVRVFIGNQMVTEQQF